jgi:lipopolysaccharide export LptBFGC system permease protein LptF
MKALARYVAFEYALMVVVTYVSLLAFFSIFELAEFARQAAIAKREFSLALELTGWNLAVISAEVGPLSALVAAVLVGTAMARRGEVTAVLSAGISPLRLILPVLAVCVGFAMAMFYLIDRVTPIAVGNIDRIVMNDIGRRSYAAQYFSAPRQWFKVGEKFLRVSEVDAAAQTYYGVAVLEIEHGRVRRKIYSDRVLSIGPELIGQDVTIERYPAPDSPRADEIVFERAAQMLLPLERRFNAFLDLSGRPQKMHLMDLQHVFQLRRRQGYDPRLYENEFYARILFPIVIVMLTLFGAALAFVPSTKRSFVIAIVELLGITLLAFVARQAFRSFANASVVSPQMGAIGPALVLLLLSLWRLRRSVLPNLKWRG